MLEDLIQDRKEKLESYKKKNDPYPARVKRTHTIAEALKDFDSYVASTESLSLTGRVFAIRDQGKITFMTVEDGTGRIQIILNEKDTHEFEYIKACLDMGDFVSGTGTLFETKRGEKSILVSDVIMA